MEYKIIDNEIKIFKPKKIDKIIIACHGFASSKESDAITVVGEMLKKHNIALVAFDFPAHGSNQKEELMLYKCIEKLNKVELFIKDKFPNIPVGLFGISYGAYVILNKLNYNNHKNYFTIILKSPAIKMNKIYKEKLIEEDVCKYKERGYTTISYNNNIHISYDFYDELNNSILTNKDFSFLKFLIMHGTKDEIAPIRDTIEFVKQNCSDKCFFKKIENANHSMKGESIINHYLQVIEEYLLI